MSKVQTTNENGGITWYKKINTWINSWIEWWGSDRTNERSFIKCRSRKICYIDKFDKLE